MDAADALRPLAAFGFGIAVAIMAALAINIRTSVPFGPAAVCGAVAAIVAEAFAVWSMHLMDAEAAAPSAAAPSGFWAALPWLLALASFSAVALFAGVMIGRRRGEIRRGELRAISSPRPNLPTVRKNSLPERRNG